MTRSDDAVGDPHLPSRGADMNDYQDHRIPGWKQLLCGWFIVLTVAALFKISDFISTKQTGSFAHAIDLTQTADVEQTGDVDHWERGVPRQQWTITVPSATMI
jgi:hypothetical protein